jgi:demethylmenaquinone methyltransferase/2-methoxy-6-polyprenyl-1,4-benzoquinol methylase
MLAIARKRAKHKNFKNSSIVFLERDILSLSFPDCTFDVCTISYGIRNVHDPFSALSEIFRVTKPGGTIIVVEATSPVNPAVRFLVNFYFSRIVPLIAKLFSSSPIAYDYFARSVEEFPFPAKFCQIIESAGWVKVRYFSRLLGSVTVFQGFRKK